MLMLVQEAGSVFSRRSYLDDSKVLIISKAFKLNGTSSKEFGIYYCSFFYYFKSPPPLNKYYFAAISHYLALLCHLIIYLRINALNIYSIYLFCKGKINQSTF